MAFVIFAELRSKAYGLDDSKYHNPYHPCMVYLPTVDVDGKCRQIYHTWILWDKTWSQKTCGRFKLFIVVFDCFKLSRKNLAVTGSKVFAKESR